MLCAEPTKHGSGIFLYGDVLDLTNLYSTIHALAKLLPEDVLENHFLGFAYEIRKAYESETLANGIRNCQKSVEVNYGSVH